MNLDMVDRNSVPEEFACIWQSKLVGIITIETEKNVNSLFIRRFRGCQLSWHLKLSNIYGAWSMKAWIPVVSSGLYFWKSVFSLRVDSILMMPESLYQTESFLTAACISLVYEPGLFRLCLKTFVAPFPPAWLIAPGSPRMVWSERQADGVLSFISSFCR